MKKCPKCNQTKELDKFYKNRSRKDGLSRLCKLCKSSHERALINEAKEWYYEWKSSQGCYVCGEKRHYCLELHHVINRIEYKGDWNKYRVIGKIISSGTLSFESRKAKVLEEAKNCIVVCANCHKEIHYLEKEEKNKNKK